MSQYLSEAEISRYCTAQLGVTVNDVIIASELIDGYLKKSITKNEAVETVKVNKKSRGRLRNYPVIDILEVSEAVRTPLGISRTDIEVSEIDLDLENDGYFTYCAPYSPFDTSIGYVFGCGRQNRVIEVRYSYGYEDIPQDVKVACAMLAQNIKQFSSFAGIKKLTTLDYSVEMGNPSFFTMDIRNILDKYK